MILLPGQCVGRERGDLLIDLGKAEAILPARERIAGEDYALAKVFVVYY